MGRAKHYKTLRLILGDQLNESHSWFNNTDESVIYLIAELHQEAQYVHHHIQKVCAFFMAMAAFAEMLEQNGHQVLHLTLDDTADFQKLDDLLKELIAKHHVEHFEYQQPDEHRLSEQLRNLSLPDDISKNVVSTEHFYLEHEELSQHFEKNTAHQLEAFYRRMRKKFDVLMNGDEPEGERWNFDQENRNKIPKRVLSSIPEALTFQNDAQTTIERIEKHNIKTIGRIDSSLIWPINKEQANELLDYFCNELLHHFGRYQDAMTCNSKNQWSLFHSRLSFALNAKILSPKHVVDQVISKYQEDKRKIEIAQVEGFVRQIIGWREFVRGIYWLNMPGYHQHNYFEAERTLPDYFWTGETKMKCMSEAIGQSLQFSYAHHIQRLMITGNFCLLCGIDPDEVDQWYLGIYVDAIEWVELPNTRGMSQFADGGLLASKPYAASANYINKMSDYCSDCHYDHKAKNTEEACPFNSLYWRFIDKNKKTLDSNQRMAMVLNSWNKKSAEDRKTVLKHGQWCIDNIEHL